MPSAKATLGVSASAVLLSPAVGFGLVRCRPGIQEQHIEADWLRPAANQQAITALAIG